MSEMWSHLEKNRSARPLALCVRVGIGASAMKPQDDDYDFDHDPSDRRVIAWVGGAIIVVSLAVLALKLTLRAWS